ncbi:hypothetical protein [Bradyrhizobium ottawaense]|uniref:hypothetical protein n=1 Tax=Bradyrhizobium ottawaense TaxID=931866 RepID=UPI0027D4FC48|nr:hypothetical protein BwSH17_75950 [Bradyrhizobium ottawaense]
MLEMTNFAQPIELSDEELDLVAAGTGSCGCGGGGGDRNFQVGLVNLNDVNIGVNVGGIQLQQA